MPLRRAFAVALGALGIVACPGRPNVAAPPSSARASDANRDRGSALLAAATALGDVDRSYLLDPTSSYAAGRGVARGADGSYRATTTACAVPRERAAGADVDAGTIDFGFVGVAIDDVLVGADVDLTAYFGGGGSHARRKVSIAAVAFVRDLDPQFFDASDAVVPTPGGCACANATHFIGAAKLGGLLAYDLEITADEAHGRALELLRARLSASDARVTQRSVGGLEIDGLDALLSGGRPKPLRFRVKNPVPIAYALHPIADVCKFAFPEPEVTPAPVDFGDVPYGREATRLLHVVNRAPVDVQASYHGSIFEIPARASLDIESRWTPDGQARVCELATREESIKFAPSDPNVEVTPRERSVRLVERVRTGAATVTERVHVDTGESNSPAYAAAAREIACPADYVLAGCRIESARCGSGDCNADGYALTKTETASSCKLACSGPSSIIPLRTYSCAYDAVAECRLRCP